MKKIFILCSILSMFLSLSLIKKCDKNIFFCETQHSSTSECMTCSLHTEITCEAEASFTNLNFIPTQLKNTFFPLINLDTIQVIVTFDRPPSLILS